MLIPVQSTQSVERIGGSDILILFEGLSLSGRVCVCIYLGFDSGVSGNFWNVHLFGRHCLDTDGMHFFPLSDTN